MLKISKAALVAAVLSLSAAPSIGLVQSLAQETHAPNSADTHAAPTVSIPTIIAIDSSMSEDDLRDLLTTGNIGDHADDLASLSATSITIPEIKLTIAAPATASTDDQYTTDIVVKNVVLNNVEDGVAESATIGSIGAGNPKVDINFGSLSTSTFNIAALLQFYGLVPAGDDQSMQVLYKDLNFAGGSMKGPNFSCTFGKVSAAEFDARPLKVSFQAMLDAANQMASVKGDASPPPAAIATYVDFMLDVFQAYKSTPVTMDGLDCTSTEDGNSVAISLASLTMDGYQPGIYPAITLNGLKVDAGEKGNFALDQAVFKSIDLSAPITAVQAQGTDQLSEDWVKDNYRSLIPAWAGFSLSGLSLDVPNPDDSATRYQVKVADFDLSLSNYFKGIPTTISTKASGIDVPVPPNTTDENQRMLLALGITRLNLNYEVDAAWDQPSLQIKVNKVSVSGNDLGSFAVSALLGNATDKLFDSDPEQMKAAGLDLALKNVQFDVTDDGLGDKLVPMLAAQQGVSDVAAYRTQMAGVAEGAALQMLGSTEGARALGAALGDFVSGKAKALTIGLTAKRAAGAPFIDLMDQVSAGNTNQVIDAFDITGSSK